MKSVDDIFAAFGGPSALARALGVNASTASEMKRRKSIPAEYWLTLVTEAERLGIHQVTYDVLALVHAREKHRVPQGMQVQEGPVSPPRPFRRPKNANAVAGAEVAR